MKRGAWVIIGAGIATLVLFGYAVSQSDACMGQIEFDTEFNPMSVRLRATRTDARAMAFAIIQSELDERHRSLCPGVVVPQDPTLPAPPLLDSLERFRRDYRH